MTKLTSRPPAVRALSRTIKDNGALLFGPLAVMWIVQLLDTLPFVHLERYGIQPRSMTGLLGIVFAPFLHSSFAHLIANTLPFLLLGGLVLLGGGALFCRVTVFVALAGGFAVWLFGPRYTIHIGASGVIFGYFGFLLARGFFEKSLIWIVASCILFAAYGSLLYGVLPIHVGVSWQSHLFGFLAGILAARFAR